tara:strand:- start:652 stop:1803 length:1152 start_codon:yes stop_codon:yes gene_type:complete
MDILKKRVAYWSPHISPVATVKAVYNSAKSLKTFSKFKFDPEIIDAFGEWNKSEYKNSEVNFYQFNNTRLINKISSNGYFLSRLKYLMIFIFCFIPLVKYLKLKKPDFLIIHLITSLPLFLNLIFKFNTRVILRISGKPKLNILRFYFWKLALKKIYKITFPTVETYEYFKKLQITDNEKLYVLHDPIIDTKHINLKKREINKDENEFNDYYICIGRLTKQKNFSFLIKCFKNICALKKNLKILILGEGEQRDKLKNLISKYNLQENIFLIGYKKNVFTYLKKAKGFILSSLWEDPGFVLVEAIYLNIPVISSDCPSGPKEIVGDDKGILFKSNLEKEFIDKFNYFENLDEKEIKKMKYKAKSFIKKFSIFRHYNILNKKILI